MQAFRHEGPRRDCALRRYAIGVETLPTVFRAAVLSRCECRAAHPWHLHHLACARPGAEVLAGLDIVDEEAFRACLARLLPGRWPAMACMSVGFGQAPLVMGVCPSLIPGTELAWEDLGLPITRGALRSAALRRAVVGEVERRCGIEREALAIDWRPAAAGSRLQAVYMERHHVETRAGAVRAQGFELGALTDTASAAVNAAAWLLAESGPTPPSLIAWCGPDVGNGPAFGAWRYSETGVDALLPCAVCDPASGAQQLADVIGPGDTRLLGVGDAAGLDRLRALLPSSFPNGVASWCAPKQLESEPGPVDDEWATVIGLALEALA